MSVIQFSSRPSDETVLSAVYRLQHAHPGWTIELCRADDSAAYVVASAHRGGQRFGAHWASNGWAVADHLLTVLDRDRDLYAVLERTIRGARRT